MLVLLSFFFFFLLSPSCVEWCCVALSCVRGCVALRCVVLLSRLVGDGDGVGDAWIAFKVASMVVVMLGQRRVKQREGGGGGKKRDSNN